MSSTLAVTFALSDSSVTARVRFFDADGLAADRVLDAEDRLFHGLAEVHVLDLHGQLALLDAPEVQDVLERTQERRTVVEGATQALLA